jgi:hypothetical protein
VFLADRPRAVRRVVPSRPPRNFILIVIANDRRGAEGGGDEGVSRSPCSACDFSRNAELRAEMPANRQRRAGRGRGGGRAGGETITIHYASPLLFPSAGQPLVFEFLGPF